MMKNMEVAWLFDQTADLMEIAGDDAYRVRAYRQASRSIADLDEDIETLYQQRRLQEIPGIGKELGKKIGEILTTGSFSFYDRLREKVPAGLVIMLELPGLGPKSVRSIYQGLGITSLEELEQAAREKKIRGLPGMGSKTELGILRGIEMLKGRGGRVPIGLALPLGEEMRSYLAGLPEVQGVEFAGSLRRWKDLVGDIDLVASVAETDWEKVLGGFAQHPRIKKVLEADPQRALVQTVLGVNIELIVVSPREFFLTVFRDTGSKAHWSALERYAADRRPDFSVGGCSSVSEFEKMVYLSLGLEYIVPELREDRGEIDAAASGTLPALVEVSDLRGDLHLHTDWSDGVNQLEVMVDAARRRGYEYIAITEHSKFLTISRGLTEERLLQQVEAIGKINRENPGLRVLTGIEVDILGDGQLDLPDHVLAEVDLVIASIHSGFRQEPERITRRLLAALENPNVDIVAHPTGRMLARREPYAFDLELVMRTAVQTRTALEINASPDRLDLNDEHARRFTEMGGVLAINTDAHDCRRLDDIRFGVMTARRGWVSADRVINAWPLDKLLEWLNRGD
ncbi:MAG: DNA polymerase/3'-5' exonuclease PolX [Firmicutes bacterium]|nr:DNA polymerase/3'-5' exonuclease PolX [Bacillota bacterium]